MTSTPQNRQGPSRGGRAAPAARPAGDAASLGLAALNVAGYIRHMDSGDQAGFGLGMMFLLSLFLPATGATLLLGAVPDVPGPDPEPSIASSVIGVVLRGGAIGMALFVAVWSACEWIWAWGAGIPSSPAIIGLALFRIPFLAFGGMIWGCAVAIGRPAAARSGWFVAAIVMTAVAEAAFIVSILGQTAPVAVVQVLVTFGVPGVIYVLVAVRTLWVLRPARPAAP